jgi:hypothetical protein
MPKTAASVKPGGLTVEKWNRSWYVRHTASGLPAIVHLRLRRHAAEAMAELYATGVDWTLSDKDLRKHPERPASVKIAGSWFIRARQCCQDGDHYSPYSYRNEEGRCIR